LTVHRPEKRNAINDATVEEIDQVLALVEKDPQLRVLILTGAGGKAFVAGAEIHELDKRDMLFGRTETRRRQDVDNHIRLR
jgi:enoyl-CoA hydratase